MPKSRLMVRCIIPGPGGKSTILAVVPTELLIETGFPLKSSHGPWARAGYESVFQRVVNDISFAVPGLQSLGLYGTSSLSESMMASPFGLCPVTT